MKENMFKLSSLLLLMVFCCHTVKSQVVGIFQDPNYYELNRNVPGEECLDEVFNLKSIVTNLGYGDTLAISDINNFANDLIGVDVLLFPDMEMGDFSGDINTANIQAIRDFVSNGGLVVSTGDSQSFLNGNRTILNTLFGYNLTTSDLSSGSQNNSTNNRRNTCYAGLPDQFSNFSPEGNYVLAGNLPSNATVMYEGPSANQSSVVEFSEGMGKVIYLSWDFRQSIAGCRDASPNWNQVLNCAISSNAIVSIPTLGEWGLIILVLLIAIGGVLVLSGFYKNDKVISIS